MNESEPRPRRPGLIFRGPLRLVPPVVALSLAMTVVACTAGPSVPEAAASARPLAHEPLASVPLGRLTLKTPYLSALGPLRFDIDMRRAIAAVEAGLDTLRLCYEQRLVVNPGLAGRVTIHANITPSGAVDEYCITEDTVGDDDLRACVNALILESRFPEHAGVSADVSFPLEFSPRGQIASNLK